MLETAASQNLEVSENIDQLDSDFNLLDYEEIYAMNAIIHKQPSAYKQNINLSEKLCATSNEIKAMHENQVWTLADIPESFDNEKPNII